MPEQAAASDAREPVDVPAASVEPTVRERLAWALAEEVPGTRAELLHIADHALTELAAAGYVVVREDLALHAYDAGREDERTFGARR